MTRSELIIWFVIALTVAVSFFAMSAIASPAHATDWDWSIGNGSGYHHHKPRRKVRKYKPRPEVRYYAPPLDDDRMVWGRDDNPRSRCTGRPIEIVSTEHTTRDNALEAGRKLWAAQANWKEGAQYQDLKVARDYREHCGPSDPMDTLSGRLNEAVNSALGKDGQNVRCIIRAEPCRAIMERVEGHP